MERTKTLVKTFVGIYLVLILSLWYFNKGSYDKVIIDKEQKNLSIQESKEKIKSYNSNKEYYVIIETEIRYTKSWIPYKFNKQIITQYHNYFSKG